MDRARDGVRAELLKSVDERRMPWLLEFLQGFTSGPEVSESASVYHLAETLLSLAAHGECVVVGRGAAQVLPAETTLRLRLVGPRKDRVAAIQRRYGCSRDEAERWVEQRDREWRAFVKDHFQKDIADADQYDLLLNASRSTAGQCAEFAVTALRRPQENTLTHAPQPSAAPAGRA
jgi:cytidylate kinase